MKVNKTMKPSLKKNWAKPLIMVTMINDADIICASGDLENYDPEEYNPWQ